MMSFSCFFHTLWIWLVVPRLVWVARTTGWALLQLLYRFENYVVAPIWFAALRGADERRLVSHPCPPSVELESLGLEPHPLSVLKAKAATEPRVEIGEFDQDGFLFSELGPIGSIPSTTKEAFLPRARSSVKLVLLGDSVVVEKDFRGSKSSFVRELTALRRLNSAQCPAPALLKVDFKKCTLSMTFSNGKVLREELAKAGAVLRDRDVASSPEYRGEPERTLRLRRIAAGKKVLRRVVGDEFVQKLYRILQDAHLLGMTPMNIKYGNVIIEKPSGDPCLIDFEGACPLLPCGRFLFSLLRDYDTKEFNLHFGTHHLTYFLVRKRLKQMKPTSDIYVGGGLSLGDGWRAAYRYGRWKYFTHRNLPALEGKRVLNLNAGNGFHALQILRLGATQVVALESDAESVKQGRFIKQAAEWADNRSYDLKYIQMGSQDLLKEDLGWFDVVFAPTCLDKPGDGSVGGLIEHLSTIAKILVCGYDAGREIELTKRGSWQNRSPHHPSQLLQEHGFRVCGLSAPCLDEGAFIIAEAAGFVPMSEIKSHINGSSARERAR
jgi:hypothetical protein